MAEIRGAEAAFDARPDEKLAAQRHENRQRKPSAKPEHANNVRSHRLAGRRGFSLRPTDIEGPKQQARNWSGENEGHDPPRPIDHHREATNEGSYHGREHRQPSEVCNPTSRGDQSNLVARGNSGGHSDRKESDSGGPRFVSQNKSSEKPAECPKHRGTHRGKNDRT